MGSDREETTGVELEALQEEIEKLTARNRQLALENKAVRTTGKGVLGIGGWLLAGPGLVKAFRGWYQARSDGNVAPVDEAAKLSAAVVRRIVKVGWVGLVVAALPIILLFQQNRLLSKQNDALARDTNIARRAQLIATLYETDCSRSEIGGSEGESGAAPEHEGDNVLDTEAKTPEDETGLRKGALTKICPPRADPRSRAEAAKALYLLDHPEPTWLQRLGWRGSDRIVPGTDLSGAKLQNTNLSGANLIGANLSGANLTGADLAEANLSEANLFRANLTEANLAYANLSLANLNWANLSLANLSFADFSLADFSVAGPFGAELGLATSFRANLTGANLIGADLGEARDLWQEQIDSARSGSAITRLPEDLKYPCHWYDIKCEPGEKYGEPIRVVGDFEPVLEPASEGFD